MKNKWMITLLACALCVPVFAAEQEAVATADELPVVEAQRGPGPDMMKKGEFKKAQKEHRAKMKATEEKMEKLVKEYQKLKGKKQEAKKEEIAAEIANIREVQLKFKQAQLDKFAKRLEEMKKHVAQEQTAEAKKVWVDKKTDELIEAKGDLKVLFEREGRPGMQDPRGSTDRPKMDGKKGPMHKGLKDGKDFPKGPRDGFPPPPPPPAEEE